MHLHVYIYMYIHTCIQIRKFTPFYCYINCHWQTAHQTIRSTKIINNYYSQ